MTRPQRASRAFDGKIDRGPRLHAPRFAGLRRAQSALLTALVAILLQVVLLTDHLGAAAIAATGRAAPGAQMGLLQICTGEGIVYMTPQGETVAAPDGAAPLPGQTAPTGQVHSQCAVCGSASVCAFEAPDTIVTPARLDREIAPLHASLERLSLPVQTAPRFRHARAPPVV
ncbi:hypothetical protein BMI91_00845 [Thioclava sediminum]|uniref:DUF2946 domain-containing protein n=1 Tax=Thioclava sediminum TaxID=1915319 RepID=A0ABX3MZ84_9RHOB|nr:DUF2946 family protein [Thioclava sediminum]OOY25019.1 hypothetical protein BMI91_00845 [Thioclava sediminum]